MPFANPSDDPYAGENRYMLNAPSSRLVAVTPSDSADVTRGLKSLRVFNTTASAVSVKLRLVGSPADGSEDQTVKFPPGLTREPLRVQRVFATPSTTGLEFHGYTD